ncbi:MAG: tetratricopeptide repeat protein [Oscillospiraceae bacterium]|nr:tetratricopeptide repeat protein [Oscillospiraceae bacterium]
MNSDSLKERVDLLIKEHEEDPFRREIELKKLLKQAEKSSNVYCIGFINFHLAFCIFQQGKRGSMLPYSYKAVKIFEKMNDKTALARSYNLMGIVYAGEENFQAALFSYFKALDLIRGKRMAGIRKETLLNNIGDSYYQMGAYQKSLSISLKCLSGCKKNNPENHRSIVLYGLNTADNYCCLNEFQQAKQTLQSIAESANQLQKCSLLSAYYARCAWVSYATGDAETGARNADQCLEMIAS